MTGAPEQGDILAGSEYELHIAPQGLALTRGGVVLADPAFQTATYEEIAGVEVPVGRRQLQVRFSGDRAAWTIAGVSRPEALWAQTTIEQAVQQAQMRKRSGFSERLSAQQLSQSIDELATSPAPDPVVLADLILTQAVQHRATDVHMQPTGDGYALRFRMDGELVQAGRIAGGVGERVVARMKVMAGMKTYTRNIAQNGRLVLPVEQRTVDIRLTSLPTVRGEKLTARLFDPATALLDLKALGMEAGVLERYKRIISRPRGCILLTGPAGSGKTTTMYASLEHIKSEPEPRSISTVEEPVEFELADVDQTEVNRAVGLDFANCLRTVLRQDPQVIMVGEIRDPETAGIAVQAGLTGHLVFSTVHAPSAAGVFARLTEMGLEPYLVASSVTAVVAQRLVRKVCPSCAEPYHPSGGELDAAGLSSEQVVGWGLKRGRGCAACDQTGYAGRTGVFELLPVTLKLREAIIERRTVPEIEGLVTAEGIESLWQAGLEKVRSGVTTLSELMSVLGGPEV